MWEIKAREMVWENSPIACLIVRVDTPEIPASRAKPYYIKARA